MISNIIILLNNVAHRFANITFTYGGAAQCKIYVTTPWFDICRCDKFENTFKTIQFCAVKFIWHKIKKQKNYSVKNKYRNMPLEKSVPNM